MLRENPIKNFATPMKKGVCGQKKCIDYFTFGMEMPGRKWQGTSDKYRYAFNGKENSNEINEGDYDFGARILDARTGRWLTWDPLRQKYPGLSPYNFAANNPIIYLDPDGKDIVPADIKAKQGFETQISKNFSGELSKYSENIKYDVIGTYKDNAGNQVELKGFTFNATSEVPNPEVLATKIKQSNASDEQKAKATAYANAVSSIDTYVVSDATSTKEEQIYGGDNKPGLITSASGAEAEKNFETEKNEQTTDDLTGGDTKYMRNERTSKDKQITTEGQSLKKEVQGGYSINGSSEDNMNKTVGDANQKSNNNKYIKGKEGDFKDKSIYLAPSGKVEAKPSSKK